MIETDPQFVGFEIDALRKVFERELIHACCCGHRDTPKMQFFFRQGQRFQYARKPFGLGFRSNLTYRIAQKLQKSLSVNKKRPTSLIAAHAVYQVDRLTSP